MGGRGPQSKNNKRKANEKNRLDTQRIVKAKRQKGSADGEAATAEGRSFVHKPVTDPRPDGQDTEPARTDQERFRREGAPSPEPSLQPPGDSNQRHKEWEPAPNGRVSRSESGLESDPDSTKSDSAGCSRAIDRPETTGHEPTDRSDRYEWMHVEQISSPSRVHRRSTVEPVNIHSNTVKPQDESELSDLEDQGWVVD